MATWSNRWRVVAGQALRVDIPRPGPARRAAEGTARSLPPGTDVVLCDRWPGARSRCRRFAERTGIIIGREYVAIPSLGSAAFLVHDAPGTLRYFSSTIATVPPGVARVAVVADAALRAMQVLGLWRLLGAVVPGRVVVGRRA